MPMSGNPILRTLAIAASAALLVTALAVPVAAADKSDCKKGGWQDLTRLDGSTFKKQGQCVKYVVHGGEFGSQGPVDACTYLNRDALDGTYASHGPVTLEFDGDSDARWAVADTDCPAFSLVAASRILPDGTEVPIVGPLASDSCGFIGVDGSKVQGSWARYPGAAQVTLVDVVWASDSGQPLPWRVECTGS